MNVSTDSSALISIVMGRLNALEENQNDQDTTIAGLNTKVSSQDTTIAGLNAKVSSQDTTIAGLNTKILASNLRIYEERKKANDISSKVVKCNDVLKLVGESSVTVGGVATVIFGGVLCAVPGCVVFGVPVLTVGVVSTATGGALLGNTGSHMSKRNKIYEEAHKKELKISYNEANDLANGKEVPFISKDTNGVRKITIKGNEIIADNPNLRIKWK